MKGKSLFLLIDELNKAERHQLLNVCKRSGDKRHAALYQLMKKSNGQKDEFEHLLDLCAKPLYGGKKDEHEKDKIQRRFIDFSLKEIEQVKLKNFLGENQLMRNFLLSRIYTSKGDPAVELRYLERTGEYSEKENDRFMTAYFIDRMMEHTSKTHTKKEMQHLKQLLIQKNALIQKSYHGELARVYDLLSVLTFEDTELTEGMKALVLTDDEVEVLIQLSSGSTEEVEYLLASARFVFYDEKLFSVRIRKVADALKRMKASKDLFKLKNKYTFLLLQHQFHFGESASVILNQAENLKDSENGLELFYYHLIRILAAAEKKKPLPDSKEIQKIKMEEENQFRKDFLLALIYFLQKDFSPALKKLNQLSYVSNFQLSTWSRLMEFAIHLSKANLNLCESLSGRISRHFLSNKGKRFTLNSSKVTFQRLNDELKGKTSTRKSAGSEALCCLQYNILRQMV